MSYLSRTIQPNEVVLYQAKPHFIVFLPSFIWSCATLFFIFGVSSEYKLMMYVFTAATLYELIDNLIYYAASEFAITSQRILIKTGFISVYSLELLLGNVGGIVVSQSILGRILDYGTIKINGAGTFRNTFHKISHPLKLRNQVQKLLA